VGRLPRRRPARRALHPAAGADLNSRFDNRAALEFYRELSELPPDFLISDLPSPLFAFWGEEDEEIARGGVQLLAARLDRRGLKHASFPGHDHEGMLAHIDEACRASWPGSTGSRAE
jgi:hypothetical protein